MAAILFEIIQFFDSSGNPLAGGKVYTFDAGTSTPKAAYTDATAATAHANPVVLDSAGRAQIWLLGAYKLRLDDANDVAIITLDNVNPGGAAPKFTEASASTTLNASAAVGGAITASGLIPDGARVLGVFAEVTTAFGTSNGLTGFNVGGMGSDTAWGSAIALTLGTKTTLKDFGAVGAGRPIAVGTQDVVLTAVGGDFDAAGAALVTVVYETGTA